MKLTLASYKLRYADAHVRAMPARDAEGCPFHGPGVDIRGDRARAILDAAIPVTGWLAAREPDIVVRSLSLNRNPGGDAERVLVTLEPAVGGGRPRVLRFDPPFAAELATLAARAEDLICRACVDALARRRPAAV